MALSPQHDEARLILDYFAARPRASGAGGTMVDVGAHFGSSFRPYLDLGWRVIAFEPDATKHAKLQGYAARPGFTLRPVAVGDASAEAATFYTSPESTGIASLVPFRESHAPAGPVAVTTLAAELAALGVTSIDYLKTDTEGYDLNVLRGHGWRVRPEVLMCEIDETKTRPLGHDYRTLADLLVGHGYVVWLSQWAPVVRYGGSHAWHSIAAYPCELHHPDAWGNVIAVRQDAGVETMRSLVDTHAIAPGIPSPGIAGRG